MVVEISRAIADVAREYKINETTVGNWVRAYREKHGETEEPLTLPERAQLRELGVLSMLTVTVRRPVPDSPAASGSPGRR
jgi:transposase-like protein